MMLELPGRTLHKLSRVRPRSGWFLHEFAEKHSDAWLLGGPTIAREALSAGLVDEVHLCRVGTALGGGMLMDDYLYPHISGEDFPFVSQVPVASTDDLLTVQTYRKRRR